MCNTTATLQFRLLGSTPDIHLVDVAGNGYLQSYLEHYGPIFYHVLNDDSGEKEKIARNSAGKRKNYKDHGRLRPNDSNFIKVSASKNGRRSRKY